MEFDLSLNVLDIFNGKQYMSLTLSIILSIIFCVQFVQKMFSFSFLFLPVLLCYYKLKHFLGGHHLLYYPYTNKDFQKPRVDACPPPC